MSPGDVGSVAVRSESSGSDVAQRCWGRRLSIRFRPGRCRLAMFGTSPGDPILPMAMSPGDVVQVAGRSETWGSDVAQRCWTASPVVAESLGAMSPGDVGLRASDVASDVAIGRRDVACEVAPKPGVAQRSSFWIGDVAGDVVGLSLIHI